MYTPATLEIAMLSFEGPDQYSQAGGLGVRAKEICRAFAALGYVTTLYFVGDPAMPEEQVLDGVRLVRCCQELSGRHPAGVYDGEHDKIEEMNRVLPTRLIDTTVRPAVAAGRVVAILAEEWQTAELTVALHTRLVEAGLREHCVLLWNANNHFGFDSIDWSGLEHVATVTTVSRYMKHLMRPHGVNPMVVHNGIPAEALAKVDVAAVRAIRVAAGTPCLAFKIGRFSPDKRWHQSLDAIAELRAGGLPARLLMRGGIEHFGHGVLAHARHLGLSTVEWNEPIADAADVARAVRETDPAAVINLRHFLPASVLPVIAAASTAVLANSGHEPFGLVGLEAMAAGGVAVVGATGEEYARSYGNAIVVETAEGTELASALRGLVERPDLSRRLRRAGRRDAADFAWPEVIDGFLERLRYVAARQHVPVPQSTTRGHGGGLPRPVRQPRATTSHGALELREVSAPETYELRHRVLRRDLAGAPVPVASDDDATALHLAIYSGERIVGVVRMSAEESPVRPGQPAVRFRGMAVDPAVQRNGVGSRLMTAVVERARAAGAHVVWANGRDTALGFYTGLGFAVVGGGFLDEVTRLPHHLVVLDL